MLPWIPVATVSFQYMPEIQLNHALLSTLTDAQREAWVNSTPGSEVFRLNKATQQVRRSTRTRHTARTVFTVEPYRTPKQML